MATIAWFGAGLMGSGFVEALRARGEDVVVYNRTFEKAKALERFGARAVRDPKEAARGAARIHIMLADDAAVDGLLETLVPELGTQTVVVDHSTVAPHATADRFARMAASGIAFVHAPVFMPPQGAREATGLMLAAGNPAVFERVRGELERMTGKVWYVGETPHKAAALKLFGNEMLFFVVAGLADTFALAKSVGMSPTEAAELFEHFKLGSAVDMRAKKIAQGDFTASFELTMARKDARLMLETAAQGHVALDVLPTIAGRMDALIAAGHGKDDVSVLAAAAVRAPATV